jgi:Arc/MetJ family transcription regulator
MKYVIILRMRTTLRLDDEVLSKVKRYAENRSLTLGEAVNDLVQRALTEPRPTKEVNGVRVFDLPPESPRVSTKKVRELDAEQK